MTRQFVQKKKRRGSGEKDLVPPDLSPQVTTGSREEDERLKEELKVVQEAIDRALAAFDEDQVK